MKFGFIMFKIGFRNAWDMALQRIKPTFAYTAVPVLQRIRSKFAAHTELYSSYMSGNPSDRLEMKQITLLIKNSGDL